MNWKSWQTWIHGLIGGVIGASSNAVVTTIVAPQLFNFSHAGLINLAKVCGATAIFSAALYLKQSPLPVDATPKQ